MLSAIDAETAALLPEKTERLPVKGRENEFVVTLDVFHQMHCLDVVRMALYRDRYDKHFYLPNGTVDYCKWLHVGTSIFAPLDHSLRRVQDQANLPPPPRPLPGPSSPSPFVQCRYQRGVLCVERYRARFAPPRGQ